ncbi:MAG: hypothetical protein FJX25_05495 [Alphaproteobacteria bacterium]|nr:hypothetical protein [Alphaproteobacteria bacterium]
MNVSQFKAAIANMADADLREALDAIGRARDHAAQLKISARLPECAAFGAIARDLDYSLGIIRRSAPEDPAAEDRDAEELPTAALVTFDISNGRETATRP